MSFSDAEIDAAIAALSEPGRLTVLRSGRQGTVLAVGPLADAVMVAVVSG